MWGSRSEVEDYYRRTLSELSETQRDAYEYIQRCGTPRMAEDLVNDLHINPLSAGAIMHDLAVAGLVKYVDKSATSHGHPAVRYRACHLDEIPEPLPPAIKQDVTGKWIALQQLGILIAFVLKNHPEWECYLKTGEGLEPEFDETLILLANIRRSVLTKRRTSGLEES